MKRLSSSHNFLKTHYDVVVIGSGYGGSITASRLSRAGQKVCILERGKELLPGEYPETTKDLLKQVQTDLPDKHIGSKTALFDIRYNKDINVIVGCGLGGTSLINAGINEQPDKRIFADTIWPPEIRNDAESGKLDKFNNSANAMLNPSLYPGNYPSINTEQAIKESIEGIKGDHYRTSININFKDGINHVGIKQPACVNCGDCMTGCNYGSKNTLLMNYLPDSVNHGSEIYTEIQADYIQKKNNIWRIFITSASKNKTPTAYVEADIVVLSAGTLGSTEILFRSSEQGLSLSNRLGERFSGNGDMVGISYNSNQPINAIGDGATRKSRKNPVGPTATSLLDTRPYNELKDSMVMSSVSIPGALGSFLPKSLATLSKLTGQDSSLSFTNKIKKKMRTLTSMIFGPYTGAIKNTAFFLAVSQDDSKGQLYMDNNHIRVNWPTAGKDQTIQQANLALKKLSASLNGTYIPNPVWNDISNQSLITGHPLGGCAMALTAEYGVVNHKGQVFSSSKGQEIHSGLYVNDAAIIPRSLGINPLNAISTLAERNCHYLIKDYGWSTDE